MKKFKFMVVALAAVLFMPMMTSAATELPAAVDGVITLTEDVTLTTGYVVESGENTTINLNGFTLTNNAGSRFDTIYVRKGGNLTVTGSGTVTNNTKGYAPLFNNGTTEINGGTFKRDTTGGNDWYVLLNHGTMTINNATVSVNGTNSSLVDNGYASFGSGNERTGYVDGTNELNPTLTINGGLFDGGMNTIKNDDNAILTINEGTFQNNYQVSLQNWNIATINGGTFNTPQGNDKTNIFVGTAGANSVNKGILTINNGTFNAEHILEGSIVTPVTIKGGTFNYTTSFINTGNAGNSLISGGTVITGGTYATEEIQPEAGYTKYQIGANDYLVAPTVDFDTTTENITITEGESTTILLPEFVSQYAVISSSDESIATVSGNVVTGLKAGEATITVSFNGETKTINLTVKAKEVAKDNVIAENPNTGDSMFVYVVMFGTAIASLIVSGLALKKEVLINK